METNRLLRNVRARKVPPDWGHPKNENGEFIPLLDASYQDELAYWEVQRAAWGKGFIFTCTEGWIKKEGNCSSKTFEEWCGDKPIPEKYRPGWHETERTHWQMYEDCTEGTPISPVFETQEELAQWLTDSSAKDSTGMPGTYSEWMETITFSPKATWLKIKDHMNITF